ncbi:MAG TPA: signal peptidase I [Verrucomicrobiae bacterium]
MTANPPPLPRRKLSKAIWLLIPLVLIGSTILLLRITGLVRPFKIPTGGMAPAVSPGDHILMEGISYLRHPPAFGDIVVHTADGLPFPKGWFVHRLAGSPGDKIRIQDGHLYINDQLRPLTNSTGEILHLPPPGNAFKMLDLSTNYTVPPDHYFVLGDNSTNSLDSRFWGPLPAKNIKGRIFRCYYPSSRSGPVK